MPPTPELRQNAKQSHTPVGPTVGIVVIILMLLLGALYFLSERLNNTDSNPPSYIPAGADTDPGPGVSFETDATLE